MCKDLDKALKDAGLSDEQIKKVEEKAEKQSIEETKKIGEKEKTS